MGRWVGLGLVFVRGVSHCLAWTAACVRVFTPLPGLLSLCDGPANSRNSSRHNTQTNHCTTSCTRAHRAVLCFAAQVALTEAVDMVYEMGGGNALTVTF